MRTSLVVVLFGLTACRHELAKPICVENPADPVCFEPGGDDAGSDAADADAIPASCGDTGPLEEACGKCGRRQRTCVAPGVLGAWGACIDEKACTPGEVVDVAGSCPGVLEKKTKKCGTSCEWEPEVCALPKGWTPIAAPPTSFVGRVRHSLVWTGEEMIVFGGAGIEHDRSTFRRDGARYSPRTNSWKQISVPPASFSARKNAVAIWTGKAMFVWGGEGAASDWLDDGALYNPVSDSWTVVTKSPLAARSGHAAVWTGSHVLIWGGVGTQYYADGALYDPATDAWTTLAAAPVERRTGVFAGWTGKGVVLFGGETVAELFGDGAVYDPSAGSWSSISSLPTGLERRGAATAIISGDLFLFGGAYPKEEPPYAGVHENGVRWTSTGWTLVPTPAKDVLAYPGRFEAAGWCSPSRCYVWSGFAQGPEGLKVILAPGGAAFDVTTNSWSAMPTAGEPAARASAGVVWTGKEAFVWGGYNSDVVGIGNGALFVP